MSSRKIVSKAYLSTDEAIVRIEIIDNGEEMRNYPFTIELIMYDEIFSTLCSLLWQAGRKEMFGKANGMPKIENSEKIQEFLSLAT